MVADFTGIEKVNEFSAEKMKLAMGKKIFLVKSIPLTYSQLGATLTLIYPPDVASVTRKTIWKN